MDYHYIGKGSVIDLYGISRSIHASMLISDQLMTWQTPRQPVHITPGQPLPSDQYCFNISKWEIIVDKIGTLNGSSGAIYLELAIASTFSDKMWFLYSDADNPVPGYYSWSGELSVANPSNWENPSAPDYGHLPGKLNCNLTYLSQSIGNLFKQPVSGSINFIR